MATTKLSFPQVFSEFKSKGLTLNRMSEKGGYTVRVNGELHRLGNLQTALNFLAEQFPASKIVVPNIKTKPVLRVEAQLFSLMAIAILEGFETAIAVVEKTLQSEPEQQLIYTTAITEFDLPGTSTVEVLDLMSGSKQRWRVVQAENPTQYNTYREAGLSAVLQEEWDVIKAFQIPYAEYVAIGRPKQQKQQKQPKQQKETITVSNAIGKNGKPKAVNNNGEYQAGIAVKAVRPGSKIDKIINALETGATLEALSEISEKKVTAGYIAQRLSLRGYGMRKDGDRYFLVKPQ